MTTSKKLVKKAVIYARVSSEEQVNCGTSLEMQEQTCTKWAQHNGYEVAEIFIDAGKTGTDMNRRAMQDMLKYIKKYPTQAVIAWKLDRLSRSLSDFYGDIVKATDKAGADIVSVTENIVGIYSIATTIVAVLIAQAQSESQNNSQRTRANQQNRIQEGYFLGHAPFGYKNSRSGKHGIIVPDEDTCVIVKRAYELYAMGLSMEAAAQELNKLGFKTKDGKPFTKRKIELIIKNPIYMGKVVQMGLEVEGKHTPLVTPELYYRVQSKLSGSRPRTLNENIIYTNFIKCACGCAMTGYETHGAHNSGNYIYYNCTNYKKAHKKVDSMRQEVIDRAFQDIINSFSIPPEMIKSVKNDIAKAIHDLKEFEAKSLKELTKRYDELSNFIQIGTENKLRPELQRSTYIDDTTMSSWQREKDSITIQMSELNRSNREAFSRINLLIDFCNRLPELYLKATPKEKRLIVNTIVHKIEYSDGALTVELKPIFEQFRGIKNAETAQNLQSSKNHYRTRETQATVKVVDFSKKKNLQKGVVMTLEP